VTATTGELFERGYVTREAHPSDGRKTVIHITDLGRETLNQERQRRAGSLADAIIHQLNDDEQRRLKDAVDLLARLARYSPNDQT
jgi:DNA-binding MarR family transcriptional regulator